MIKNFKVFMKVLMILQALAFTSVAIAEKNSHSYLAQNWSEQDRQYFYFADQGSRLLPYDYFLNLEQVSSKNLFRNDENMARFGLIPAPKSPQNPDALPIGMTRNKDAMGFTCAACHTQKIMYKNRLTMIDGGQTLFDLQMFLSEMTSSMKVTLMDADKFTRFQQRVLGSQASEHQINELKTTLNEEYEKRKTYSIENHTDVAYGYARLDAFGAILNRALSATGVPNNTNPPNAPTSYPYLWDTPQHDYVEWNGSQSNSNVGAFARNVGEVIGVFGEVKPTQTKWLGLIDGGYKSSIQTAELRRLEKVVGKLQSPQWPAHFPKVDIKLAQKGHTLYQKYCISCHVDIKRDDPARMIKIRMSTLDQLGTDPMMAQNAILNMGKSGQLKGQARFYVAGKPLQEIEPAIDIANNIMVGVIVNNPLQAYLAKKDAHDFGHADDVHSPKYVNGELLPADQAVSKKALLGYKARPLNGVWTSAPFLHNGSVPNLYQLLLPAKSRMKQFYVGSMAFDPKNIGFETTQSKDAFLFDTTLAGNSNLGHEYGAGYGAASAMTEDERWALIEYVKTL